MSAADVFSLEISAVGSTFLLKVHGTVGEDFSVSTANLAAFKEIRIECAGLRFINSRGLKKFVNWLREVEGIFPNMRVHMVDVSPTVNRQLVSMAAFLAPNLVIDSLFLPYYCDACDNEDQHAVVDQSQIQNNSPPDISGRQVNCPKCGQPMEFDADVNKFFMFMLDRRSAT